MFKYRRDGFNSVLTTLQSYNDDQFICVPGCLTSTNCPLQVTGYFLT